MVIIEVKNGRVTILRKDKEDQLVRIDYGITCSVHKPEMILYDRGLVIEIEKQLPSSVKEFLSSTEDK